MLKVMSRWQASLIHLSISAIIASAVLALMLLVWYPYPLFTAVGGQQVLMILLAVDVTLGPFITLLVFELKNKSLRALKFDLVVIALLQISALLYGTSVIFQARPAFMVFSKDSFDLITANTLSGDDLAKAKHPAFRSLPLIGPVFAYTEMPAGIVEQNEIVLGAFAGKDLPHYPQYYQPLTGHMEAIGKAAKTIHELQKLNPEHADEIAESVRDSGLSETELGYVPLRAKHMDLAIIVQKNDGKVLDILLANPWQHPEEAQ